MCDALTGTGLGVGTCGPERRWEVGGQLVRAKRAPSCCRSQLAARQLTATLLAANSSMQMHANAMQPLSAVG